MNTSNQNLYAFRLRDYNVLCGMKGDYGLNWHCIDITCE